MATGPAGSPMVDALLLTSPDNARPGCREPGLVGEQSARTDAAAVATVHPGLPQNQGARGGAGGMPTSALDLGEEVEAESIEQLRHLLRLKDTVINRYRIAAEELSAHRKEAADANRVATRAAADLQQTKKDLRDALQRLHEVTAQLNDATRVAAEDKQTYRATLDAIDRRTAERENHFAAVERRCTELEQRASQQDDLVAMQTRDIAQLQHELRSKNEQLLALKADANMRLQQLRFFETSVKSFVAD